MLKSKLTGTVHPIDGICGLLGFFLSLALMKYFDMIRPLNGAILIIVLTSLSMIISTFAFSKVHRSEDYAFDFNRKNPIQT